MYDAPAPGWYPDPTSPSMQRWWDGSRWGEAVAPMPVASFAAAYPAAPALPTMPAPPAYHPSAHGWAPAGPSRAPRRTSWSEANQMSLMTLGVAAVYLVIAVTINFVLIGFIPISMAVRAMGRREPLRFVALGAAIVVLAFGLLAFAS